MSTLPYYVYSKNIKNIGESTSEYQFKEKKALEENDSGADELYSSTDEESPAMAEVIDDRAVFLVGGTSGFGGTIKLSSKVLS